MPRFFRKSFWSKEESFPGRHFQLQEYNRDNLLISNLASRLSKGRLTLVGNAGSFFAFENSGADITLEGDCGWRSCYGMKSGFVAINGEAGHDLGLYSQGGTINVRKNIRSISESYVEGRKQDIYQNGKLVPKQNVVLPISLMGNSRN